MIKQHINRYLSLFIFSILLAAFASCESEKRPEEVVGEIPEVMSYSDHIQPIWDGTSINVEKYGGRACTDCHNGQTPPNLTQGNSYIELVGGGYINIDNPESSNIYEVMAFGSMKQYTNITDVAFVLEWITQGAEDN